MKSITKYKQIGRIGIGFTTGNSIPFDFGHVFYDCVHHFYVSIPRLLIEISIEWI